MLSDKVIFLTGGTEGIGLECAKAYAACGARLAIISNNADSISKGQEQLNGKNIMYILADVSSRQDMQNAIAQTLEKYHAIDAIHNNAGITYPSKNLHDTSDDEWDTLMNINVIGIYYTTKFGIDEIKKSNGC